VSARRKARKRALDFLYEADIRSASAIELLGTRGRANSPNAIT
jgi:N utilization substance protein B